MTRRRRDAVKCLCLALTALIVSTASAWTTTGVIYALGGLVLVLGSGLVGGVAWFYIGFKKWEGRLDQIAREQSDLQRRTAGNRRLRAITAGEK